MKLSCAIPILRSFSAEKAREFYIDFIVQQDWGQVMQIDDPFGNRLRFCQS
jgi:hypothetical protein